ncbi:hypothetical protein N0V88_001237 [Collariella sp. IMI 366227]|nr:hypothetical protein N0V88_001237 [Collariella sp. IMI 366227]
MASFVSSILPVPSLPEYTGPYKVGTVDVEIPVSQLESPSPQPEGASEIKTVLFRIFYPAVAESRGSRASWLPAPQRLHIGAYAQFLGAGTTLASVLSAVLTFIRDPQNKHPKARGHMVPYIRLPHDSTPEIWETRNKQLRIRLWELGLILEALTALDRGDSAITTSNLNTSTLPAALTQFTSTLDILTPGRISDHFFKWTVHLHAKARILSLSRLLSGVVTKEVFEKVGWAKPLFFILPFGAPQSE